MHEKSGTVVLTQDDLDQLEQGVVSDRVRETWNFTLAQLQEVVDNNSYTLI